ncbi:MAG TPA: ABC transporter permease [Candidatus Caccomorpha excrementavium]|nr:ABC transporter permease [Candidatus Caccomorpha excrementavium]
MNIIGKLTLRQLAGNRKRTIVTICGIIISTAMLTAIPTVLVSFLDWMAQQEIYMSGPWHLKYQSVTTEQADILDSDSRTESVYRIQEKCGLPEFTLGSYKPYIYIRHMDENAMETDRVTLLAGSMPENDRELLVTEQLIQDAEEFGEKEIGIGDEITLTTGERHYQFDDETLSDTVMGIDDTLSSVEIFISQESRTYRICGIMETLTGETDYSPGYLTVSSLNPEGGRFDAYVILKNVSNRIYDIAPELAVLSGIAQEEGITQPVRSDRINGRLRYHSALLRYQGVSDNDGFNRMLLALGGITITVIILGSVALIYNAFAISLTERSKYLGMLASVGATKKQKRFSVLFEGFCLGIISIPLGILAGLAGIGITFRIIAPALDNSAFASFVWDTKGAVQMKMVISGKAIFLAAACSAVTILISAWIPARRASKIAPIEAIRGNRDVKLTAREVKTPAFITRLFGIEAGLGLKNLKRNRRRYRATVFSLVVSIVIFLTMSVLTEYLERSYRMTVTEVNYDICVSALNSEESLYQDLERVSAYTRQVNVRNLNLSCRLSPEFFWAQNEEGSADIAVIDGQEEAVVWIRVMSLDDNELADYAQRTGARLEKLKDVAEPSAIVVNTFRQERERKYIQQDILTLSAGDELPIRPIVWNEETQEYMGAEGETVLRAEAVTDQLPIGGEYSYYSGEITVYVSEEVFGILSQNSAEGFWERAYYQTDDWRGLMEELETIQESRRQRELGMYIDNVVGSAESYRQTMSIIEVFTTGFMVLILAICTANIFNTMSTSIAVRRREFAMLKSVGMTPKGFYKMIHYESIFLGLKALLYGLPISFAAMYLMYLAIKEVFVQEFLILWNRIGEAVIMIIGIAAVTMLYASAKVRKGNIIESL